MMLNVATNEYINNNIFSLIKRLTNALRCTFTCYAIETILTTNRTDSLQYTALIAAYKAYPPYGGSNSVPLALYASCYPTRHLANKKNKKNKKNKNKENKKNKNKNKKNKNKKIM